MLILVFLKVKNLICCLALIFVAAGDSYDGWKLYARSLIDAGVGFSSGC